jgi:hypothetical protein
MLSKRLHLQQRVPDLLVVLIAVGSLCLTLLLTSCIAPSGPPETCTAVIDRISEPQGGYYYYPIRGNGMTKPLTRIYLRISDRSRSDTGGIIIIEVLDSYSPNIYGRVGDRVLLVIKGHLGTSPTIPFDALSNYEVIGHAS